MFYKLVKEYWYIVLLFILIALVLLFTYMARLQNSPKIVFCDVDQGDSIIFTFGSFQLLVDAGLANGRASACLERFLPWYDKTLEVVVVTHPDLDHMGGLEEIMLIYQINDLVMLPLRKDTQFFKSFIEKFNSLIENGQKTSTLLYFFDQYEYKILDNIAISFWSNYRTTGDIWLNTETERNIKMLSDQNLFSLKDSEDPNSLSIVTFLRIANTSILLTGDLDERGELALMDSGLLSDISILKVGHHGSKSSTSTVFLEKVKPEKGVISVGAKNSYGHPTNEVLQRLAEFDVEILLTSELGDIVFVYENGEWILQND